ncbi:MAG: PEP-CTERM sorting domain-containing protein [Planctomycetota bacterium]|nr:MAG: PEP-CTERM sorting domain-containing protein [Planctomycetota bacterium]
MSFARMPRVVALVVGAAALLGALAAPAPAVTIDLVPVGNAGNANDPATGNLYGGVAYDYAIGTYDVTIGQYAAFLNAVAATDTYSLYNGSMATDLNVAGITQTGSSGSYTYSVINNGGNSANRPITYVSWFDSARFANWMANGQPTGAQSSTTTENGAYNVNGATSGTAPAKNVTNPNTSALPTFFIPNESEWYKAAYYSPLLNSGSGGYYTYATQSDTAPGNVIGSGSNQANYYTGSGYSVTQSGTFSATQNYLTDVGAFSASGSFYGSFDQSGNVWEWNDLTGTAGSSRGLRGGEWNDFALSVSSAGRLTAVTSDEQDFVGFRLASTVIVPEPSTWVMAAGGLACGGFSMWRRRKRA